MYMLRMNIIEVQIKISKFYISNVYAYTLAVQRAADSSTIILIVVVHSLDKIKIIIYHKAKRKKKRRRELHQTGQAQSIPVGCT